MYYAFYHNISTFQLVKFKIYDTVSKQKSKFPDAMWLSIEVIMSRSLIKNKSGTYSAIEKLFENKMVSNLNSY